MPLGQERLRLTQTDSDAKLDDFVQNLIKDLRKPVEQTQGQIAGTKKMGSFAGNDQNTLLYDFMQKIKRPKQ